MTLPLLRSCSRMFLEDKERTEMEDNGDLEMEDNRDNGDRSAMVA